MLVELYVCIDVEFLDDVLLSHDAERLEIQFGTLLVVVLPFKQHGLGIQNFVFSADLEALLDGEVRLLSPIHDTTFKLETAFLDNLLAQHVHEVDQERLPVSGVLIDCP